GERKGGKIEGVAGQVRRRLPPAVDPVFIITDDGIVRVTTPRAVAKVGKQPEPDPDPDPANVRALRDKLDQRSSFRASPRWSVRDALEWLSDPYDLQFDVDVRALAREGGDTPFCAGDLTEVP